MCSCHILKPIEILVEKSKRLVERAVKEVLLIAQDLTYYGLDLCHNRTLAALLEKLSQVESIAWIRLYYAFSTNFPLDVLDVMKNHLNREEGVRHIDCTEYDSPEVDNEVIVSDKNFTIGEFVKVKIDKVAEFDIMGSPQKNDY